MEISTGLGIVIAGVLFLATKMFEVWFHFVFQARKQGHEQFLTTQRIDAEERQGRERSESDEKIAESVKDMKMTAKVDHSGMVENKQSGGKKS